MSAAKGTLAKIEELATSIADSVDQLENNLVEAERELPSTPEGEHVRLCTEAAFESAMEIRRCLAHMRAEVISAK